MAHQHGRDDRQQGQHASQQKYMPAEGPSSPAKLPSVHDLAFSLITTLAPSRIQFEAAATVDEAYGLAEAYVAARDRRNNKQ